MGSYKGLPMTASAFSPDGSVLAIAAGSKVTLWDPETCRLAAVLSLAPEHQALGLPLGRLAFIPGSPYLVASSDAFLAVWNLLSASLHWALDVPTCALVADPVHASFAIAVPMPGQELRAEPAAAVAAAAAPEAGAEAAGDGGAAARGRGAPGGPTTTTSSQSWQPAPRHSSHVLVFDPRSPSPRFHCACPGTLAPTLLYVSPGMPQHGEVRAGQVSPLMVLTEGRAYTYVASQGTAVFI